MKQHPAGRNAWRILVISIVLALACACATLPPVQPIGDLKDIAGKWEGNVRYSCVGGPVTLAVSECVGGPVTLTISENGAYETTLANYDSSGLALPDTHYSGQGRLNDGKFDDGSGHIYTLRGGGAKRLLVYSGPNTNIRVTLEPAKKGILKEILN